MEELEKRIEDLDININEGDDEMSQTVAELEKRIKDLDKNFIEAVDAMDEAESSL